MAYLHETGKDWHLCVYDRTYSLFFTFTLSLWLLTTTSAVLLCTARAKRHLFLNKSTVFLAREWNWHDTLNSTIGHNGANSNGRVYARPDMAADVPACRVSTSQTSHCHLVATAVMSHASHTYGGIVSRCLELVFLRWDILKRFAECGQRGGRNALLSS